MPALHAGCEVRIVEELLRASCADDQEKGDE
jgi:hypothetical protein